MSAAAGAIMGAGLGLGLVLVASGLRAARVGASVPARMRRMRRRTHRARLSELLAHAAWAGIPPAAFVAGSIFVAVLAAALCLVLVPVPPAALAAGIAAGLAPTAVAVGRVRSRMRLARAAWPDAVDHLVAAVRAGVPLPDAVAGLAEAGPDATRTAFARFGREMQRSGSFAVCADELKEALADPVADRIVETLKLAREVGGTELVAVLRALAVSLREDQVARSELEARQGWVVGAARLGVAAPWLVLMLLAGRPEGAAAYTTPSGTVVVLVAASVSVLAYRVMLAVGRLPRERRWFR